jgi:hypothetical protein
MQDGSFFNILSFSLLLLLFVEAQTIFSTLHRFLYDFIPMHAAAPTRR